MWKAFPKPETLSKAPTDKWVWILVEEQVVLFSCDIFVCGITDLCLLMEPESVYCRNPDLT